MQKKKVYLRCKDQLSAEEEDETCDVASARSHVERATERLKNYNILTHIIPNSMAEDLNKLERMPCYITSIMYASL